MPPTDKWHRVFRDAIRAFEAYLREHSESLRRAPNLNINKDRINARANPATDKREAMKCPSWALPGGFMRDQ
jgi:hypothetical protein